MGLKDPKKSMKVLQYVAPVAAAAGTVNGTPFDRTGFGGTLVVPLLGTIDAGHNVTVNLQDDDASGGSFATTRDSVTGLVAADSDSAKKLSQVHEAAGKYGRVQVVRGGSTNSVVGWIVFGVDPADWPVVD